MTVQGDDSATLEDQPLFVCDVIDADESSLKVNGRYGLVIYVRLVTGVLPSSIRNFVAGKARLEPGAFAPTSARLTAPAGRTYDVVLLATLPPLHAMRPALRGQMRPPASITSDAQPVVLEGLPRHEMFRPRHSLLVATGAPETSMRDEGAEHTALSHRQRRKLARLDREFIYLRERQLQNKILHASTLRSVALQTAVRERPTDVVAKMLLEALEDENSMVRGTAANLMQHVVTQLPLTPFLDMIKEKGALNEAACEAAAYAFVAHADEVPVDAVLDLYHGQYGASSPIIRTIACQAMGRLGERATDEVVGLLAAIVSERRAIYDIRVRRQAAISLGELGARAPVEALIACMQGSGQPEAAAAAARAIVHHPANVPEDVRKEARLLSDADTARRITYARVLERRRQIDLGGSASEPADVSE